MSHFRKFEREDTGKNRSFEQESETRRHAPRHAKMQAYKREKYRYSA